MTRLLVPVALLMGLMASPALAQPYGPPPSPSPTPSPGPGAVTIVTPCNTIIVDGDDWGPGTTITIDREFGDEDCPGVGNPPDISADAPADDDDAAISRVGNGVAVADGVTTVAVRDDGSFSAALVVPGDIEPGDFAFTISGVDASGAERQDLRRYNVNPIARVLSDEQPVSATSPTTASVAIGLLAMIMIGLLGNQFRLRRLAGRR